MSDTICGMPYVYNDAEAAVWKEKRVKVRKPHQCCECGATIEKGEQAGCATWLYDGMWQTDYRCASCLVLAEWAATVDGECGLWAGLDEHIAMVNEVHGTEIPYCRDFRKKWEADS